MCTSATCPVTAAQQRYAESIRSAQMRGDKPFVAFLLAEYKSVFGVALNLNSLNN